MADAEEVTVMDIVTERAIQHANGGSPPGPERRPTPSALRHLLDVAQGHRFMGTQSAEGRFRRLKQALLRLNRIQSREQTTFNAAVVNLLEDINSTTNALRAEMEQRAAQLVATVAATQVAVEDLTSRLADVDDRVVRLEKSEPRDSLARTGLTILRAQTDQLFREARSRLPGEWNTEELGRVSRIGEDRFADIYVALEERFRGSRDEIMERQRQHLHLVGGLRDQGAPLLDLGAGRGEWLELLRDERISAYGVDTSVPFVTDGRRRGLDIREGDGLAHLRGLPEGSLAAVTAFHLAEHLPFDTLIDLLDASLRALRFGGLLLLETPNSRNVVVGSSTFYLDPTHERPLPHELLAFLVQQRGFVDVEVRFLNPGGRMLSDDAEVDPSVRRLLEHLEGAFFGAMDYAVVAYKAHQA